MSKHIVHLVFSPKGGVERLVLGLVRTPPLDSYRHSAVYLLSDSGPLEAEFQSVGIHTDLCTLRPACNLPLPSYRLRKWLRTQWARTFTFRLSRLLRRLGPDLVHTHVTSHIDLQVHAIVGRNRGQCVFTLHGVRLPSDEVCVRAASLIGQNGGGITADSEVIRRAFSVRAQIPPERIIKVYTGIDITAVISGGAPKGTWRKRWKIPGEALIFGCVGRLAAEKGHDLLIKAASKYAIHHQDAHFVVAGGGRAQAGLESDVEGAGLTGRFHFLGYHEDLPGFLREVDVFVLPSRSEGFPLALIEALAAGRPCIAADVGGVAEMLGPDGGLLVPAEDVDALVAAMERMTDPSLRAIFSRRAPEIGRAFSLDVCAQRFAAIYERVMSDRKAPPSVTALPSLV